MEARVERTVAEADLYGAMGAICPLAGYKKYFLNNSSKNKIYFLCL